mgnify:CR=1 FL=1
MFASPTFLEKAPQGITRIGAGSGGLVGMGGISESTAPLPREKVVAKVRYVNPVWKERGEAPRIGSRESRRAATSFYDVEITDVRNRVASGEANLDKSGFTMDGNVTMVKNFRDNEEVSRVYHEEMKNLICRVTGAQSAYVLNHLVRTETPIDFNDGYARFVHCDYNVRTLDKLAADVLSRHGVEIQKNWKFAFFNTWQPFDNPVENNPLAFIDWQSLPEEDVIDYYYTGRSEEGSLVAAPVYSPSHQFCYFANMSTDEVLIMKQLDSRPDRSVYCPHTSFDYPENVGGPLPRRSIETRLVAVFET